MSGRPELSARSNQFIFLVGGLFFATLLFFLGEHEHWHWNLLQHSKVSPFTIYGVALFWLSLSSFFLSPILLWFLFCDAKDFCPGCGWEIKGDLCKGCRRPLKDFGTLRRYAFAILGSVVFLVTEIVAYIVFCKVFRVELDQPWKLFPPFLAGAAILIVLSIRRGIRKRIYSWEAGKFTRTVQTVLVVFVILFLAAFFAMIAP